LKNLIQKKLRTRFHVTPKVGAQFSGVLIAEDRDYAEFSGVVAYSDNDVPAKVDGNLLIRHSNIAYVQTVADAYQ
jgi:hypothetical protein